MRLTADSGWAAVSIRDIAAAASLSDLESAGALRPTADAAARAAFLLINDLAVVLLQDQVARVLGVDPLSRGGPAPVGDTVMEIYRHGASPIPPRPGEEEMSAPIEVLALTKAFGRNRGIDDVSFTVQRGEVFGFLGPNGAGKSTTIRLILGLYHPTAGLVRVQGRDPTSDPVGVHRAVGYLPGELALFPRMTGRQHLDWLARGRGTTDLTLRDELVERFDAELDRPVRTLSKGNRQKIGLILAFFHRPDVQVLDEPTSGLDPLLQDEFDHLLRETVASGRTVFLSSHELDEVQRAADRVAIIKDGRLVLVDTVEALRNSAPRTVDFQFDHPVHASDFAGAGQRPPAERPADRLRTRPGRHRGGTSGRRRHRPTQARSALTGPLTFDRLVAGCCASDVTAALRTEGG